MFKYLKTLCELYSQDFDLLFERATDPIDMFCEQYGTQAQNGLLREMITFYRDTQSGERTLKDLVDMGLEWDPGDGNSFDWFRSLIDYLEAKLRGRPDEAVVIATGPRK